MTEFTPPKQARQSIRRQLLLANIIVGVLLALAGFSAIFQMLRIRNSLLEVIDISQNVQSIFHTQQEIAGIIEEASQLSTTKDPTLIPELTKHLDALRLGYTDLQNMSTRYGTENRVFLVLINARPIVKNIIAISESIIDNAKTSKWETVTTRVGVLTRNEDDFSTAINQLYTFVQEDQQNASNNIRNILPWLIGVPFIATVLALLVLIFSTWQTNRSTLRPLETLTAGVERFSEGDLSFRMTSQRQDEVGVLAEAFNNMAASIQSAQGTLEERVLQRTRALRRRSRQIQTAAEVGRAATQIRDLDELLTQATQLISERFGYYHAGIFLLDADGEYAVLQAANSEGGQQMLKRGHKLKIGAQGIVGYVTQSGRPRIALDTGADAIHFQNPFLPGTRSEMALPLKSGETILGALDVQSTEESAFSQEDITVLQILADQISTAIESAHLLSETKIALENTRRAYTQMSREAWSQFIQARTVNGYRCDARDVIQPISTIGQGGTSALPLLNQERTTTIPIKIRGHQAGTIRLSKQSDQPWTTEEKAMTEDIAERMSAALESARLYSESQRRAHQLQIASEIARDTSGTLETTDLLHKVVNLVRERFGFYHASIFLLDKNNEYAVIRESTGEAGREMIDKEHKLKVGSRSIIGYVTAKAEPLVVNDVTQDPTHRPNPLLPETRAELGIPLKVGTRVLGAIDVQSTHAGSFTSDDISVLQILADQLAIALVNTELFQETQDNLAQQRLLHHVTTAAASSSTIEDALFSTIQGLHATMRGDRVSIMLWDEENQRLAVKASAGYGSKDISYLRVPLGQGVTGWVAEHRKPMRLDDVRLERRYISADETVRSELAVPLIYREKLLGVLNLESDEESRFTENDQEMLTTLAGSLAAILSNTSLLNEIQHNASRLELLQKITATAASQVNQEELLSEVAPQLVKGMDAQHCGIVLFDSTNQFGTLIASASNNPNAPGADMIGAKLPLIGNELTQEVIKTRQTKVVYTAQTNPRTIPVQDLLKQRGTQTLIIIPLISRDEVIGTIGLDISDPKRRIEEAEINLLDQISRQIAAAVDVARLFERAVKRAERERLATEITTKLRASNDPQIILETATRELQRALKAQSTQVFLSQDVASTGNGEGEGV